RGFGGLCWHRAWTACAHDERNARFERSRFARPPDRDRGSGRARRRRSRARRACRDARRVHGQHRRARVMLFGQPPAAAKHYLRGTHRAAAPAETLRRFGPCMASVGITRLADITGLDAIGLPVFVAIRPTSRALSTAQGKGLDRDAAKASAMMESIESWH